MQFHKRTSDDHEENDPVWELLDRGKKSSQPEAGPWFAARTTAKAKISRQSSGLIRDVFSLIIGSAHTGRPGHFLRLGALGVMTSVALMALYPVLSMNPSLKVQTTQSSSHFVSSEDDFQEHMELLTSAD